MTRHNDGCHVGVQVGAHSVFDEGAEHVVGHLKGTCRATALHVYAMNGHAYAPWFVAGKQSMDRHARAADHGVQRRARPEAPLTTVWFHSHGRYYEKPEQAPAEPDRGYGDRDVFDELAEPAARAGVELYARFCDWGNMLPYVPGMMDWATVNADGVRQPYLCPNNPGYRRWYRGVVEDLFRHHASVAGLNFGLERGTPLMTLLKGEGADCFCEHCCALGERQGVRADRARAGYAELAAFVRSVRAGSPPADGSFVSFFRILRNWPEILHWDRQMTDGWQAQCKDLYATVKAVDPSKSVGWHILQHLSFTPVYRAAFDLAQWRSHSDWIKPVLYHNCAGERMRNWSIRESASVMFADLPPDLRLRVTYSLLGYDGCDLPDGAEMEQGGIRGFGPDWVAREVRRCVAGAAGIPIYAGIGLDIPHTGGEDCTPDSVHACTRAALDAGAAGIVVSREYDEMQTRHLEAVGRAVDEYERERTNQ
jgi:hypothetical protein